MTILIYICWALMVVCVVGMFSCLPGMARQSEKRRRMEDEFDLQRRIASTSWTPYHPRKGKYRHRNS